MAKKIRSKKSLIIQIFLMLFVFLEFILSSELIGLLKISLPHKRNMLWLKENGIKVEATVFTPAMRGKTIYAIYHYTDENGKLYTGDCGWTFKAWEDAEAQVGKAIEIYIDEKGNSISSEMPIKNLNKDILNAKILGVAVCCCIGVIIVLSVIIVKELRQKRRLEIQEQQG